MITLHGRFAALSLLAAVHGIVVDAQDATPDATSQQSGEPVQPALPLATPSPSGSVFASPTVTPTETRTPSVAPTDEGSLRPSASTDPTAEPSHPPTYSPTTSREPTMSPTMSAQPSMHPSIYPTYSPFVTPSTAPSTNEIVIVERLAEQTLGITVSTVFTAVQQGIYCSLLAGYTVNFGLGIGPPQIKTDCTVTQQSLAMVRRKRGYFRSVFGRKQRGLQTTGSSTLLIISFTITYETKFGHDIDNYPSEFQNWVNGNLETVTQDMKDRFLPVQEAKEVIVFATKEPTKAPSQPVEQTERPSMSPSFDGPAPSSSPTIFPTTTRLPSYQPSEMATKTPGGPDNDRTSFIVGLAAGLGGAALFVFLLICYMRQKNRKRKEEALARSAARDNESVPAETGIAGQNPSDQYNDRPEYGATSPQGEGTVANSIFSNPSMVSGGGSFSSQSEENNANDVQVKQLQEEFDVYKNKDLENIGDRVDEQVHGSEGMMSQAMTRALMEDEDATNPSWGGADDPESIEANGLCEANDWLRKHDHTTGDQRCVAKSIDALCLLLIIHLGLSLEMLSFRRLQIEWFSPCGMEE